MDPRQRLLAVFNGDRPDTIPVSFFIQEEFLAWYYPDKSQIRRLEEAIECASELDIDLMVRSKEFEIPHFMNKSFPGWDLVNYNKVSGNNIHVIFEITTPKGKLRQVESGPNIKRAGSGIHRTITEYLIKDTKDLEIFCEYVPQIDNETIERMHKYTSYALKTIGRRGLFVPWGWSGVFNQAANYKDPVELMMGPYIEPELYDLYMDKITLLEIQYNCELAKCDVDGIGIQGNVANSAMMGRDFFDAHILPYEKRLAEAIKENNKFTIYHNCGKSKVLVPSYIKMGIDAWETVAEPPQGDITLKEAKDIAKDSLILIGNLDQVSFLKNASVEQIDEKVHSMMETGKTGGHYIFAASDFLESDTPIENVKAAVRAARKYGIL